MAGPRPHSLGNEKLLDSFFLHMMPRFGPYFCLIYMLCCKKQKTWVCLLMCFTLPGCCPNSTTSLDPVKQEVGEMEELTISLGCWMATSQSLLSNSDLKTLVYGNLEKRRLMGAFLTLSNSLKGGWSKLSSVSSPKEQAIGQEEMALSCSREV